MANIVDVQSITNVLSPGIFDLSWLANYGGDKPIRNGQVKASDYLSLVTFGIGSSTASFQILDLVNLTLLYCETSLNLGQQYFSSTITHKENNFYISYGSGGRTIQIDLLNNTITFPDDIQITGYIRLHHK